MMQDESEGKLLGRLDERTKAIAEDIADLKANFVTKQEFAPVKAIVFGGVGLVLVAFMGLLIALTGFKDYLPPQ